MSDSALDNVKQVVEPATSAFLDQLQKSFSAGNVTDSSAVAGNKKSNDQNGQDINKSLINDLIFDPKFLQAQPGDSFKRGPFETKSNEFQPFSARKNQVDNGVLEIPAIVPTPRDMPPEIIAKRAEALKNAPLNKEQKLALKDLKEFNFGTAIGTGMSETKELTEQLLKEKSKVAAWPGYKERFQQAITASDKDYFDVEKKQTPIIINAELQFGMANTRLTDAYTTMDKEIAKLPPAVQEKANQLKADLQDPTKTAQAKQKYAENFKAYPNFVSSTENLITNGVEYNVADMALTAARKPLVDAAREEAMTRFVYKRAADLAGDTKAAKSMGEEAFLMGRRALEIEQKEKPAASKLFRA